MDGLNNRQKGGAARKRVTTPEEYYGGMAAPPAAPSSAPPDELVGLVCPNRSCRSRRLEVVRTEKVEGGIARWRKCLVCGQRVRTAEK